MLAALAIWLYLSATCYFWGRLAAALLGAKNLLTTETLVFGYLFLQTALLWLSLVLPIHWWAHGSVGAVTVGLAVWTMRFSRRPALFMGENGFWVTAFKQKETIAQGLAALAVLFVLLRLTPQSCPYPVCVYDAGLYYAQTIRWATEYAVVPGLANLHDRLAFNNGWHLGAAFGAVPFLGLGRLHLLNGWWAALFFVWALEKVRSGQYGQPYYRLFPLLGWGLILFFSYPYLSEAQTDLAVALAVLFAVDTLLDRRWAQPENRLALFAFGLALFTFKLSAGLALLLFVPQIWPLLKHKFWPTLGLALLVLGGFFWRNYFLSGYLLFPYTFIDVFSPDWKLPPELANLQREIIYALAFRPAQPFDAAFLGLSVFSRYALWWGELWASQKIFMVSLSFFCVAKLWVGGERRRYILLALSLLLWFGLAPDLRFGLGFLAAAWAWAALGVWGKWTNAAQAPLYLSTLLAAGLWFAARNLPLHLLKPPPNFTPETQIFALPEGDVSQPAHGEQCGDAPLPCAPVVPFQLIRRGKSLQEGFKTQPSIP